MTILIIGTPDSGKSEKAEALALELAAGRSGKGDPTGQKKYYIATMIPYGEEGARRVEKHRKLREGKDFVTIEKTTAVHELVKEIPDLKDSTCLLECMSNLIGNEMHVEEEPKENGKKEIKTCKLNELAAGIVGSVMELAKAAANLVIVTNRFPMDGDHYDEDTRYYVKLVDLVNKELSSKVDKIYELIEGEWKLRENT